MVVVYREVFFAIFRDGFAFVVAFIFAVRLVGFVLTLVDGLFVLVVDTFPARLDFADLAAGFVFFRDPKYSSRNFSYRRT